MVLLGTHGMVNQLLIGAGIVSEPVKPSTISPGPRRRGHVMLPLAVLTLESVMRNVDPNVVMASYNLGASRWQSFWRIFFPLTLPGEFGAMVLVMITSLGYYITPTLLGSPKDVVIAMLIARQVEFSMNWGLRRASRCCCWRSRWPVPGAEPGRRTPSSLRGARMIGSEGQRPALAASRSIRSPSSCCCS
jgi:putative spermidine/putrescine transport system permease protein